MALSHKPQVLYVASIERMAAARREFDAKDYSTSMYLSGLSVECMLQAIALRNGARHDAHHSLLNWLSKCPTRLQDQIKGDIIDGWNRVVALWDNGIRYLSTDGLLGYLRDRGFAFGVSGGRASIIRANAKALLDSAYAVHLRGIAQWVSSTGK